jgi:hypothetical protein
MVTDFEKDDMRTTCIEMCTKIFNDVEKIYEQNMNKERKKTR